MIGQTAETGVATLDKIANNNTEDRVVTCYSVFDRFFPTAGLLDYTEGIYAEDGSTSYEDAKQAQFDYLLDQIGCEEGVRVLEVGCGNGTLLEEIRRRGAEGVGITITPEQVRLCKEKGLDVYLLNLWEMGTEWEGRFDAIVANGPIEHFVQPSHAARGEQDRLYGEMFEIFHRLLDPDSDNRRVVNTTVHFARAPRPQDVLRNPLTHRPFSDDFHWSLLGRSFGGFYPVDGQLESCARQRFELVREVDGTRDYFFTSEVWLRRMWRAVFTLTLLKILLRSIPMLMRRPVQYFTMVVCMFFTRSWNWQFRGDDPPAKLWRQTWQAI